MEQSCSRIRIDIFEIGNQVKALNDSPALPDEARANVMLAYRHLEDARMRVGKIMQALQGGVSILDPVDRKNAGVEEETHG